MTVPYLSAAYFESLLAEARGRNSRFPTEAICGEVPAHPARTRRKAGRGLAILYDADDPFSPSDARSNRHVLRLAAANGMRAEVIGLEDMNALPAFDALWIRTLTSPVNAAYDFARHAEALGMPVIDDSTSIRQCGNKAFQAERFRCRGIPTPQTLLVTCATPTAEIEAQLDYPVVVKDPDGSFSTGVFKAETRADLELLLARVLARSHVAVVQAFIPTAFDWRLGVLDGEILFACKYRMAKGHWQILKRDTNGDTRSGPSSAVQIQAVPHEIADVARRAASAIGRGLYGVDIKQTASGPVVIEVNDNPDIKRGIEDRAEGDALWLTILSWFQAQSLARLVPNLRPVGAVPSRLRQAG